MRSSKTLLRLKLRVCLKPILPTWIAFCPTCWQYFHFSELMRLKNRQRLPRSEPFCSSRVKASTPKAMNRNKGLLYNLDHLPSVKKVPLCNLRNPLFDLDSSKKAFYPKRGTTPTDLLKTLFSLLLRPQRMCFLVALQVDRENGKTTKGRHYETFSKQKFEGARRNSNTGPALQGLFLPTTLSCQRKTRKNAKVTHFFRVFRG